MRTKNEIGSSDWFGEIPEGWKTRRVKSCIRISNGSDPETPGDIPVWGSGAAPFKTCGEYKNGPTVLLGRKGTLDAPQYIKGRYWNVDTAFDTKPCSKDIYFRFFYYTALCIDVGPYSTNTAKPSMTQTDWGNIKIPLPPLSQQHRIADYLDAKCAAIDADVAKRRELVEKLKEYRKCIISHAVTRGLDAGAPMKDSGVEWIGEIPEGWEVVKIGQQYDLRKAKTSDAVHTPLSVTMQGILPQLDHVAKTDAHDDRKMVKKGDFVINSRSDRRGACGIAEQDGSVSLINTVLIPRDKMNPRFYSWLFHTPQFADEFYRNGHGIVDDLWTTRWCDMKSMSIVEPPLDEQERIADYLDAECAAIDAAVAKQEQLVAKLGEYRKSVIHAAVTGRIDLSQGA